MSYVTNVMISTLLDIDEVPSFIKVLHTLIIANNKDATAPFYHVPNCEVGSTKCLEKDLFLASFNYLNLDDFKEFIKNLPTLCTSIDIDYENFQVFILSQNEYKWRVFDFNEIDNLSDL